MTGSLLYQSAPRVSHFLPPLYNNYSEAYQMSTHSFVYSQYIMTGSTSLLTKQQELPTISIDWFYSLPHKHRRFFIVYSQYTMTDATCRLDWRPSVTHYLLTIYHDCCWIFHAYFPSSVINIPEKERMMKMLIIVTVRDWRILRSVRGNQTKSSCNKTKSSRVKLCINEHENVTHWIGLRYTLCLVTIETQSLQWHHGCNS